jgi:LysM repeat protein
MRRRRVALFVFLAVCLVWPAAPVAAQGGCGPLYTVRPGDTLLGIAQMCGTTLEAILQANPGLGSAGAIVAGQVLALPAVGASIYIVQEGDTLFGIARRLNTTVGALLAANPGIVNPNRILIGQVLVVPARGGGPGTFPAVTISPTSGVPGTVVQVSVTGFPAFTPAAVAIGRQGTDLVVVQSATTDGAGAVVTHTPIPSFAVPGEVWLVQVSTTQGALVAALASPFTVVGQAPEPPPVSQVQVYLMALGAGDVGCGDRAIPITRNIPATQQPLPAAIQELLGIEERFFGQSGLYNALAGSSLRVLNVQVLDGRATIELLGTYRVEDVCDIPRVREQVRRTALQFPFVSEVIVVINGGRL